MRRWQQLRQHMRGGIGDGAAPGRRAMLIGDHPQFVALARHRQRGADLVYEAYDVDIGGG